MAALPWQFLCMFIFIIGSSDVCFVLGLITCTDSETVCLGDMSVTFCILSLKGLVLGNFSHVTRFGHDCDVS